MANENHASYAKVGLTVVAGVAAIIGTLIYIGGVKDTGGEILIAHHQPECLCVDCKIEPVFKAGFFFLYL